MALLDVSPACLWFRWPPTPGSHFRFPELIPQVLAALGITHAGISILLPGSFALLVPLCLLDTRPAFYSQWSPPPTALFSFRVSVLLKETLK